MNTEVMFSSDKSCWETPRALFEQLDAEFHFTLDAAASDENHKCGRYFTEKEDGLRQNWGARRCFATLRTEAGKPGCGQRNAGARARSRAQRWFS